MVIAWGFKPYRAISPWFACERPLPGFKLGAVEIYFSFFFIFLSSYYIDIILVVTLFRLFSIFLISSMGAGRTHSGYKSSPGGCLGAPQVRFDGRASCSGHGTSISFALVARLWV